MERYRVIRANSLNNHHTPRCSQISLPSKAHGLGGRSDDTELRIFDAERYFSEGDRLPEKTILNGISESCDSSTNPRDSSVSSQDGYGRNWRNKSFRATPTASSEASWNSQSGLLSNPPGSVAVSVRAFPLNEKRRNGSKSFSTAGRSFFGRNCPCIGKKSVTVEEKKYAEPKLSPVRISSDKVGGAISTARVDIKEIEEVAKMKISAGIWAKDSALFSPEKPFPAEIGHRIVNSGRPFVESAGFSFPILAAPPLPPLATGADDPPRESLEVFQPSNELMNLSRSAEFHRRKAAEEAAGDDDVASDTSSDLFEIESFSTNPVFRRRDSLDEFLKLGGSKAAAGILQFRRSLEESAASIAPTECYAPSEVSVEWSVTTAEGGFDRASTANFSSAASDYDEVRFIQTKDDRFGAAKMAGNGGGKKKGGLLSCRCENSVNVGPNPVRIGPEQKRDGNVVFADEPVRVLGMTRFALEKAELVRSHSVRVNRPIQTR